MIDKMKGYYKYIADHVKDAFDKVIDHEFVAGLVVGFIIGVIL